jgi:hypothetical protein
VNVGVDHDTAGFAVATSAAGGADRPGVGPHRDRLLVCADAGGSNGYRIRLWKTGLAWLAAEAGLVVTVCHFPPGTSKTLVERSSGWGEASWSIWLSTANTSRAR